MHLSFQPLIHAIYPYWCLDWVLRATIDIRILNTLLERNTSLPVSRLYAPAGKININPRILLHG